MLAMRRQLTASIDLLKMLMSVKMPFYKVFCIKFVNNIEKRIKVPYFDSDDFDQLCHAVDVYWRQKKSIAPGCEPQMVKNLMDALSDLVHGQSLAGAGGLSFILLLTGLPFNKLLKLIPVCM